MLQKFARPVLLGAALLAVSAVWAHKVTLTVASFPDLPGGVKLAIPPYQTLNPNVEIKPTSLAYADHHTAMTTALATGAIGSWGGSFYGIPKKAQNKAAAWDFITFLSTHKDMQIEAFRSHDAFAALLEAQNDPFVDQPIEYLGGQKPGPQWQVAVSKIAAYDVGKHDRVANEVVNAELEKVLDQNKDIKTARADAQAQLMQRARR